MKAYFAFKVSGRNSRSFMTSSSTHFKSGTLGGWFPEGHKPDFISQQKSLTRLLLMGLNGISLVGTPLCGSKDPDNQQGILTKQYNF